MGERQIAASAISASLPDVTHRRPLLVLVVRIPAYAHDHWQDGARRAFALFWPQLDARIAVVDARFQAVCEALDLILGEVGCVQAMALSVQLSPTRRSSTDKPTRRTPEILATPLEAVLHWAPHVDWVRRLDVVRPTDARPLQPGVMLERDGHRRRGRGRRRRRDIRTG